MALPQTDVKAVVESLRPGQRIRATQRVTIGFKTWTTTVTGTVRDIHRQTVGIHTNRVVQDEPWVEAILIEKDDGELTTVTLDENSVIEPLTQAV